MVVFILNAQKGFSVEQMKMLLVNFCFSIKIRRQHKEIYLFSKETITGI